MKKYIKIIKARGYTREEGKHIFNKVFEVVDDCGDTVSILWPKGVEIPPFVKRIMKDNDYNEPVVMAFSKDVGDVWKYVDGKEFIV